MPKVQLNFGLYNWSWSVQCSTRWACQLNRRPKAQRGLNKLRVHNQKTKILSIYHVAKFNTGNLLADLVWMLEACAINTGSHREVYQFAIIIVLRCV